MKESISEQWFNSPLTFKTYKRPSPIKYQTATDSGLVETLEGPVVHEPGFKIITGPKGEQYPVPPEKFTELYDDSGNGVATPKKIMKEARLADHDGVVHSAWAELNYTKGNDFIVRHGPGDYGVIKRDIFFLTYDASGAYAD